MPDSKKCEMKNIEKADRIHLESLMEELKKGHFVIPDFQNQFLK